MKRYNCDACRKSFASADALAMHNSAKHTEKYKKPMLTATQKKRARNWTISLIAVALIVGIFFFLPFGETQASSLDLDLETSNVQQIPPGAVHWHPNLEIIIDGKSIAIPPDIGYGTGKMVDTQLSGMRMSPIHTHESTGRIHIENNNPSSKPETVTLGYMFYVWEKQFNESCIFQYCTDEGTLTISVNGKESIEFEKYIMRDNDKIVIEYISFDGSK